jgi:hypothetical protein
MKSLANKALMNKARGVFKMKKIICSVLILCILAIIPTGMSQQEISKPIVNLMIDVTGSLHPTEEQATTYREDIKNIYNSMIKEDIPSTMFFTQDVSSSQISLYLTQIGLYGDIEFGMSSNHSGEKLSSKPYSEQLAILQSSKKYADTCHVCGKNEKPILGFKPQSFDQNEDTYKALDEIGLEYDAGFQAGILYAPGHENDVWPYLVEGHKFYAVPVSTYTLSGKKVPLQDSYFKDNGLSATQWYDALVGKFDEIQGKDEPLVFSITTSISGSGDYLDALKRFLSYATSNDASFVNTKQLVDMAKAGVHDVSSLPATNASAGCLTCEKPQNNVTITIFTNNTQAATA